MPQKVWAVGEEVLATDFNTYVQQQIFATFPNVAARDTWASPPNGAMCITTDTYTVWTRVSGAWVAYLFAAVPWIPVLGGIGFTNGWTDLGSGTIAAAYRKVADVVQVRGVIRNGTITASAFTLPAGYRPPGTSIYPGSSSGGTTWCPIVVAAAGTVVPNSGTNSQVTLEFQFSVTP
jgi:hypothetical protein